MQNEKRAGMNRRQFLGALRDGSIGLFGMAALGVEGCSYDPEEKLPKTPEEQKVYDVFNLSYDIKKKTGFTYEFALSITPAVLANSGDIERTMAQYHEISEALDLKSTKWRAAAQLTVTDSSSKFTTQKIIDMYRRIDENVYAGRLDKAGLVEASILNDGNIGGTIEMFKELEPEKGINEEQAANLTIAVALGKEGKDKVVADYQEFKHITGDDYASLLTIATAIEGGNSDRVAQVYKSLDKEVNSHALIPLTFASVLSNDQKEVVDKYFFIGKSTSATTAANLTLFQVADEADLEGVGRSAIAAQGVGSIIVRYYIARRFFGF